uniref:Putative dde superfamily endonuclease n=2 Tax=Ixodes ricinus TaxID=34613 RepID=A0A090XF76_IXORI
MKMKHGLTFAALSVLFSVHRTTASRTFYAILDTLYTKTQGWLVWFPRDVVQETMPPSFREKYPTCRVIIDCTEVPIEKPPELSEQINCWSSYKSDFSLKFLIGITPSGFISFVSNVFGGRSSDTYITANSGLLDLLEPNDLVMADKGFPHIRCDLDARKVALEIPPFASMNEQFTALQVERTYKIASHRVHVERCIQRIKSLQHLACKTTLRAQKSRGQDRNPVLHSCEHAEANFQGTRMKEGDKPHVVLLSNAGI